MASEFHGNVYDAGEGARATSRTLGGAAIGVGAVLLYKFVVDANR